MVLISKALDAILETYLPVNLSTPQRNSFHLSDQERVPKTRYRVVVSTHPYFDDLTA